MSERKRNGIKKNCFILLLLFCSLFIRADDVGCVLLFLLPALLLLMMFYLWKNANSFNDVSALSDTKMLFSAMEIGEAMQFAHMRSRFAIRITRVSILNRAYASWSPRRV